ncbi:hypothetical protein P154DRAFT_533562 [Amniculicola lignicola CBS 123094]|uniref:Uncharacterized protein n=1 Tax=Amniculicola lignicola CBS 123094 TaxID=1392246 RepID=A0A6A5WP75_9PLEO|nr:hypothetical protein P154DRAFT_533562 [Amniculicola lignicola CBS 123094]
MDDSNSDGVGFLVVKPSTPSGYQRAVRSVGTLICWAIHGVLHYQRRTRTPHSSNPLVHFAENAMQGYWFGQPLWSRLAVPPWALLRVLPLAYLRHLQDQKGMPVFSIRPLGLLDCTNDYRRPDTAPGLANAEAFDSADLADSEPECDYPQDPIDYHSTTMNTSISSISDRDWASGIGHRDQEQPLDLDTSANSFLEGDRQQNKSRRAAHSLTVRPPNRANRISLAPIIERGSYSTLNSHGSLMSANRLRPTIGFISATALNYASPKSVKGEHFSLHKIHEYTQQEAANVALRPRNNSGLTDPRDYAASLHLATLHEWQPTETPVHALARENGAEITRLKGVLRSVLHNDQAVSCPSDFPCPVANPTLSSHEGGERTQDTNGNDSSTSGADQTERLTTRAPKVVDDAGPGLSLSPLMEKFEIVNKRRSSYASDSSLFDSSPVTIIHVPPARGQLGTTSASVPEPNQGSSSPSECPNVETCEGATITHNHSPSATPIASNRSRDDVSTRYTFDGVPLYRSDAPSLFEYDRARDASFCSSNSTTYSGTVLGVDLDLHHAVPSRRGSPSLVPFGPQRTAQCKRNRASYSLHPKEASRMTFSKSNPSRSTATKKNASQSITSSALPILLPLAAASGIGHTNHASPRLSFVSPSGKLIQAESSSPPISSPTSTIPYPYPHPYPFHNQLWPEPLIRPVLLPAMTPPSPTALLPGHLRPQRPQQQGYHHHSHTHIAPRITVTGGDEVKGCDGVIRTRSLQPRSGVRHTRESASSTPSRSHTSAKPGYFRSRFHSAGLRIGTQRHPKGGAGNGTGGGSKWYSYAGRRSSKLSWNRSPSMGGRGGAKASGFGTAAALGLRICFCQPWDGVGERADGCLGDADQCDGHAHVGHEGVVKNARIVHGRARASTGKGERKAVERRDGGFGVAVQ